MKWLSIFIPFALGACATSAPDGEKQLIAAIEADRRARAEYRDLSLGRPKLVKVRAYRHIQGGDIVDGHWIYLQVGREQLKLKDLVGE